MSASNATSQKNKVDRNSSWFALIKQAAVEWVDDDAQTWAAAVACYALLALAPLLILAIRFLSVFLSGHVPQDQIQSQAQAWMGDKAGEAIAEIVKNASRPGSGSAATVISLILAVVSVGGVFGELQSAMNRIWKVKSKPGNAMMAWLWARVKSVVVVLVAALLLLASVVATTWLGKLTASVGLTWKYVGFGIDVVASLVVLTLLFALLYRSIPDAQIEWRPTLVGAVITAVLFEVGKYGLALYFKYASPSSAYGAVGSLAAVLIWIYYSSMILFFGVEFTQVYAKARGHGVRPSKHAEVLSECDETETPTPSQMDPGEKPQRPAKERRPARAGFAGSTAPGYSGKVESGRSSGFPWAGVATVMAGAVLSGLGVKKIHDLGPSFSRDIKTARLHGRLCHIEDEIARVARFSAALNDRTFQSRVAKAERRVRQARAIDSPV
jgi:membrane protein